MRRVLIDTNIYVAFKKNMTEIVDSFRHFDYIGINITVIAELLCGFKGGIKENSIEESWKIFLTTKECIF